MIIQDGGKSKRIGNPGLTFWNIPFVRRRQISENGFLLKPLTPEDVREQLKKLRYPFSTGGADE